ncbi:MAG: hypothetical protein GY828_08235, partial [Candidatus Gracilibacteria bacterium]|nr:hypothetical protein [Candidatus Gracilibacteria bacterium]
EENGIDICFYSHNGKFVSTIEDSAGITPEGVMKYLLPIGKSGKTYAEGLNGKFGQGFFSLLIGAQEVNIKTSIGNGITTYVQIVPIYNEDNLIEDFDIKYEFIGEEFKGTKIERVDESEGVNANFSAMFGVNNIVKYIGVVSGVDIRYNGESINGNKEVLQEENIPGIGRLQLLNHNNIERITKNGLYVSEIKDIYLDMFPQWIIDIVKENRLTIDLPSSIDLVSSRNQIADENDLIKLKPYIFKLVTKFIVNLALDGKIKIPMLPEDYFGMDYYEKTIERFHDIIHFSKSMNNGGVINIGQMSELLKNKSNMALFLLMIEQEKKGEKVSLQILKKRRYDKEFISTVSSGRMEQSIAQGVHLAESKKMKEEKI